MRAFLSIVNTFGTLYICCSGYLEKTKLSFRHPKANSHLTNDGMPCILHRIVLAEFCNQNGICIHQKDL